MELDFGVLENFEREYYDEIIKTTVTLDAFKKVGISEKSLAREMYLRKIYGDSILSLEIGDSEMYGKKMITKLSESDFGFRDEFKMVFDEIEKSSFDAALDMMHIGENK